MKKSIFPLVFGVIFFIVFLVLNFLPGEKPKTDEEIYQEAYWEGYHTAENDTEKKWMESNKESYAEGYLQAVKDIRSAISDEIWDTYEAAMEVGTVHGFVSNPDNDPLPSTDEYLKYVEDLYYFWEFFEQNRYERYLEYK